LKFAIKYKVDVPLITGMMMIMMMMIIMMTENAQRKGLDGGTYMANSSLCLVHTEFSPPCCI